MKAGASRDDMVLGRVYGPLSAVGLFDVRRDKLKLQTHLSCNVYERLTRLIVHAQGVKRDPMRPKEGNSSS